MVNHEIQLQGINFNRVSHLTAASGPAIYPRTDQEFLPAILDELKTEEGQKLLAETLNRKYDENNIAKLFQPIHRTFNIVLMEAFCVQPGIPRLDPKKIASAGLVIRRKIVDDTKTQQIQGWLKSGNKIRGWVNLTEKQQEVDPVSEQRTPEVSSGNAHLDKSISFINNPTEALTPANENVTSLFVAPEEVCKAAGKTILYAILPLTSSELSEAKVPPPVFEGSDFSSSDPIFKHLSKLLTRSTKRKYSWCDGEISRSSLSSSKFVGNGIIGEAQTQSQKDWEALIAGLEQLHIEFDLFGDSKESKALQQAINKIQLPYKNSFGETYYKPALEILKVATEILIDQEETPGALEMPVEWPAINEKIKIEIWKSAKNSLNARVAQINPGVGRFDDLDSIYQIDAFVRVNSEKEGCPTKLIWSRSSEPFTIAPWYESSDTPPIKIALPNVTDKNFLKRLKPDVSFSMPESLFNSMKGARLDALMDGKKPDEGSGIGLGWICSFNIPIITFCAFFVLSIFLSLFNFIFRWLLFVKICIPFPVKK